LKRPALLTRARCPGSLREWEYDHEIAAYLPSARRRRAARPRRRSGERAGNADGHLPARAAERSNDSRSGSAVSRECRSQTAGAIAAPPVAAAHVETIGLLSRA